MNKQLKITIAGASGFVGKNLIDSLSSVCQVKALSRSREGEKDGALWKKADLFSYQSTEEALKDTDVAFYLVHSMLPSSRLFQGEFQDTDLLLADNFAKACIKNNVKQIIYLGGLVPEKQVSKHLESRREVEDVFKASKIATTVLRAGMVAGVGGSSFEILRNLVLNLPCMVLPKWTASKTQAIYIDDLIRVMIHSIDNKDFFGKTINAVNGEELTYADLIKSVAKHLDVKKPMFSVPVNYTSFSKLWVKIFGNADYELVSPLIDSLLCNLPHHDIPPEIENLILFRKFEDMLPEIKKEKSIKKKTFKKFSGNTVRSIQRLPNPYDLEVDEICDLYFTWLPSYMKNLIKVYPDKNILTFKLAGLNTPLLVLSRQEDDNDLDRLKLHIKGGILSKTDNTGWLEFRKVHGTGETLASINEFVPSLPWYIYRYSQALIHLQVMHKFGDFLERDRKEGKDREETKSD